MPNVMQTLSLSEKTVKSANGAKGDSQKAQTLRIILATAGNSDYFRTGVIEEKADYALLGYAAEYGKSDFATIKTDGHKGGFKAFLASIANGVKSDLNDSGYSFVQVSPRVGKNATDEEKIAASESSTIRVYDLKRTIKLPAKQASELLKLSEIDGQVNAELLDENIVNLLSINVGPNLTA